MVTIEIDGEKITAESGDMIIEAADTAGIYIPRFCYHKKLSIAANCRMCLVEVEGSRKPLPACATPITDGMKVSTHSEEALYSQKAVMEFLLINHPLDCPICDQGGECELQDVALGFGSDVSQFSEGKRAVEDKNLGSLISTDMTRCIHCTRCVRFGEEVAGLTELGLTGRGENSEIGTYIEKSLTSELSGNIVDLCPVGALTSKPYRFNARAWELQQHTSVAPHDCIGSNIHVHTRRGEVMRVVPCDNESINETWISDRDRFSYVGLRSKDRIHAPLLKQHGTWVETDWPTAFDFVVSKLRTVLEHSGPQQIGALASQSSTVEELYLLQKVLRGISCHNVDHRVRQTDFADQSQLSSFPSLGVSIEELEKQQLIMLVGANVMREQPIAAHRIRKAALSGTQVMAINPVNCLYHFPVMQQEVVPPQELVAHMAGIAKALDSMSSKDLPDDVKQLLNGVTPTDVERSIAGQLARVGNAVIIFGQLAINHPQASILRSLGHIIAELSDVAMGYLTAGANTAGAWLAGAVPHRLPAGVEADGMGLAAADMLEARLKAYVLFGLEPDLDCANPQLVADALAEAEFVVSISPYGGEFVSEHADAILPMVPFSETSGTFVNVAGTWQSFQAVTPPLGEARPGWKILRVLGNQLQLDGFDYLSSQDVRNELQIAVDTMEKRRGAWVWPESLNGGSQGLCRIAEWPLYANDAIVRRSGPLQQCAANEGAVARMNAKMAKAQNLATGAQVTIRQGSGEASLPVVIDDCIPDDCVWVPAGYAETAKLAESFGPIEIMSN